MLGVLRRGVRLVKTAVRSGLDCRPLRDWKELMKAEHLKPSHSQRSRRGKIPGATHALGRLTNSAGHPRDRQDRAMYHRLEYLRTVTPSSSSEENSLGYACPLRSRALRRHEVVSPAEQHSHII